MLAYVKWFCVSGTAYFVLEALPKFIVYLSVLQKVFVGG
jgi:uncharacterized protein YutD